MCARWSATSCRCFISRGVVQISAYVDSWLASFLGTGAVSGAGNAQTLYTLPVSLFGMAVSAAELPAMSSALGSEAEIAGATAAAAERAGCEQIAFFVIPSAMAFCAAGRRDRGGAVSHRTFPAQRMRFLCGGSWRGRRWGCWRRLWGGLYSSTFYALRDTRTPLRFAVIRVVLTLGLGYLCALPLPRLDRDRPRWGAAGLTASAGIAGWVEFLLLRATLNRRIGATGAARGFSRRSPGGARRLRRGPRGW